MNNTWGERGAGEGRGAGEREGEGGGGGGRGGKERGGEKGRERGGKHFMLDYDVMQHAMMTQRSTQIHWCIV